MSRRQGILVEIPEQAVSHPGHAPVSEPVQDYLLDARIYCPRAILFFGNAYFTAFKRIAYFIETSQLFHIPRSLRVCFIIFMVLSVADVRGRRRLFLISPSNDMPAFTGIGLLSTKQFLNSGIRL